MTDEATHRDELVSAYLDGEATPAEIAAVEQDGALMARVEQLRAVRDAVAAPVPPASAERRDRTIGAALTVADEEADQRRSARIVPPRGRASRGASPPHSGEAEARAARERSEQERGKPRRDAMGLHLPAHALRRRREALLAVAAAAVLVAAVVSAGLIAGRGGDDVSQTASEASAPFDDAPEDSSAPFDDAPEDSSAAATAAAQADMAMVDDSADYETAAEAEPAASTTVPMAEAAAPTAEEELTAEAAADDTATADTATADDAMDADDADDGAMDDAEAADDAAAADEADETELGPAMEDPAEEAGLEVEQDRRTGDRAATPVVDLGAVDDYESLFDDIAASWSAARDGGAAAAAGVCFEAVNERAAAMDVETRHPFTAAVGAEEPVAVDGLFARRAGGAAVVVYAAPPGCEAVVHELDGAGGSDGS